MGFVVRCCNVPGCHTTSARQMCSTFAVVFGIFVAQCTTTAVALLEDQGNALRALGAEIVFAGLISVVLVIVVLVAIAGSVCGAYQRAEAERSKSKDREP